MSPRRGGREDQLFSAPLPTPIPRLYRELGVQPDASSDEVAWAKVSAAARLRREQAGLEQALDSLEAEVGGLRDATERLRRLRGAEQPEAEELRAGAGAAGHRDRHADLHPAEDAGEARPEA